MVGMGKGKREGRPPMRPLTPRRLLSVCAILAGVLFVAVVFSLRLGAYSISSRDIVMTLINGMIGRTNQTPSEFSLVVCGCRELLWGFWWVHRSRLPAPDFRPCSEIRWPILTFWASPAAPRSAPF